jgi:hypothetical protein
LDSPIIDVAIGISAMFLLIAVAASAVNEGAEAALKRRSKFLRAGIAKLLGDDPVTVFKARRKAERLRNVDYDPAALTNLVYDSPLIKALGKYAGSLTPKGDAAKQEKKDKDPSYIPGETFASAVIGTAANLERLTFEAAGKLEDARKLEIVDSANDVFQRIEQLDEPAWLKAFAAEAKGSTDHVADEAKRAAARLEALKTRIATHFDDAMDRVAGWYKRRTRWWLVLWSAVLVVGLNSDAIAVSSTLWSDDALRESVVAQAALIEQPTAQTCPDLAAEEGKDGTAFVDDVVGCVTEAVDDVEKLNLPLGWPGAPWSGLGEDNPDPRLPAGAVGMAVKALGLALTIGAASLGAPFWFGLLNKLTNLRASGSAPKRTDEKEKEKAAAAAVAAGN